MNITINDRKFWVNWNYTNLPMTKCQIWTIDESGDKYLVFVGTAYQSLHDPHNKEKARKITLQRAIRSLTKETRTQIWEQYFNRKAILV